MTHADAVVIGGGPAGATAALRLASAGRSVVVLEGAAHPRFHVGESLLPCTVELLDGLGLAATVEALPQVPKPGAEFVVGHGDERPSEIWFSDALDRPGRTAFNVARAPFDAALLAAAADAGAEVREEAPVRVIERLGDGDVTVSTPDGVVRGRWLLDASGQGAVVGRHLGIRRVLEHHRKIAVFAHYSGVWRNPGDREGFITVVMCDEGWFWIIPLDRTTTSVGVVLDRDVITGLGIAPRRLLDWAIRRCPVMADRCRDATPELEPRVEADFSYSCRPFAAPGAFLVGDAAAFVDPVFSTGVSLALASAAEAAGAVLRLLDGADPAAERRRYRRFVDAGSRPFFRFVDHFYRRSFRDLFLEAEGPLGVHRAAIAVLAGHVFPRPAPSLRWRLRLLDLFVTLQALVPLVPRRRGHSLVATDPTVSEEVAA